LRHQWGGLWGERKPRKDDELFVAHLRSAGRERGIGQAGAMDMPSLKKETIVAQGEVGRELEEGKYLQEKQRVSRTMGLKKKGEG